MCVLTLVHVFSDAFRAINIEQKRSYSSTGLQIQMDSPAGLASILYWTDIDQKFPLFR